MSMVNFDFISEPATKLIEKISEAIGGIARPGQIVRVAKAEAKAEIIRTNAKIEISEIEKRGLERLVREEGKKQENIEAITAQSIPLLTDQSKPENIENDWISNFFDKCKLISDVEMQKIWSSLLAGEANTPGTYSKRTIQILSSLDKADAELFSRLSPFYFEFGIDKFITPILLNADDQYCKSQGINFIELTHLNSLGLIEFNSFAGFTLTGIGPQLLAFYSGAVFLLNIKTADNNFAIETGKVLLTKAGKELATLTKPNGIEGYAEHIFNGWQSSGKITSYNILAKEPGT